MNRPVHPQGFVTIAFGVSFAGLVASVWRLSLATTAGEAIGKWFVPIAISLGFMAMIWFLFFFPKVRAFRAKRMIEASGYRRAIVVRPWGAANLEDTTATNQTRGSRSYCLIFDADGVEIEEPASMRSQVGWADVTSIKPVRNVDGLSSSLILSRKNPKAALHFLPHDQSFLKVMGISPEDAVILAEELETLRRSALVES
jgi:hypothetical protein